MLHKVFVFPQTHLPMLDALLGTTNCLTLYVYIILKIYRKIKLFTEKIFYGGRAGSRTRTTREGRKDQQSSGIPLPHPAISVGFSLKSLPSPPWPILFLYWVLILSPKCMAPSRWTHGHPTQSGGSGGTRTPSGLITHHQFSRLAPQPLGYTSI